MPKMTVDISSQAHLVIKKLAKKEGRDKCQILRRAIGLYAYLSKELNGTDGFLAVVDKDGKVIKKLKWV